MVSTRNSCTRGEGEGVCTPPHACACVGCTDGVNNRRDAAWRACVTVWQCGSVGRRQQRCCVDPVKDAGADPVWSPFLLV
eukprot:232215-Chlamydomonas_euryale.AAC.1